MIPYALLALASAALPAPVPGAPGVEVVWKASIGESDLTFAASDSAVFYLGRAADEDSKLEPGVVQVRTSSGALVRRVEYPWQNLSQIAVAGGRALFLSLASEHEGGPMERPPPPSELWAMDVASGKRRWGFKFGETFASFRCEGAACFVGTCSGIVALDAASGRVLWRSGAVGDAIVGGETWFYEGLQVTPKAVYSVTSDDYGKVFLRAFSRATGKTVWAARQDKAADGSMAVSATQVAVSWQTGGCNPKPKAKKCDKPDVLQIESFDQARGASKWSKAIEGGEVVASDADLLLASTAGFLVALEAVSGEERWRVPMSVSSAPIDLNLFDQWLLTPAHAVGWSWDSSTKQIALEWLDRKTGALVASWPVAPNLKDEDALGPRTVGFSGELVFVSAHGQIQALRLKGASPSAPAVPRRGD